MGSILARVPQQLLDERRRLGHDRRDEVWEGVLHMVPPAHGTHGRLNDGLGVFFKLHWEFEGLGKTFLEAGVKRPGAAPQPELGVPSDYRTPDRSFLRPARYDRFAQGWIVGGPDAVLEILSPGDESREKLPFYFDVGVIEVLFVDRQTRATELLRARDSGFVPVDPDADGWLQSDVLQTSFRTETNAAGQPTLHLRRTNDPARELVVEA